MLGGQTHKDERHVMPSKKGPASTIMKERILITSVTVSVTVALAIAYVLITAPRRSLDRFLREVSTVEVGKTKLEDWRTKVERAQLSRVTFKCNQQMCDTGWHAENTVLRRLRLAPRSVVDASVGFKDGVASEIHIIFVKSKRDDKGEWHDDEGVAVRQSTDVPSSCHQHYILDVKDRYQAGDRYWATVAMDSCVSPQDRARALRINSSCLTRIGGCKTIESMIPQVFARP
jgi:hypothetical protein